MTIANYNFTYTSQKPPVHVKSGFTLIEVMVGMVLATVLWVGMFGMFANVDRYTLQLSFKQKAVFRLDAEMKRLVLLINDKDLFAEKANHADSSDGIGRWLYRAKPAGVTCQVSDPNCFLLTYNLLTDADLATFGLGQIAFFDDASNNAEDQNIVWIDRASNVTGSLEWTLTPMTDACCHKLVISLSYPYRFKDRENPLEVSMGNTETLTLETIVMTVKEPFVACNPPAPESTVQQTGQTITYAANDDGDLKKGVAWPDPRFTDNGNGTVTDNLTNLVWLKTANCFGNKDWITAVNDANNLADSFCGLADGSVAGQWRLPSIKEISSLADLGQFNPTLPTGHPFTDVSAPIVDWWTSTTAAGAGMSDRAWRTSLIMGGIYYGNKLSNTCGVWPVRDGP